MIISAIINIYCDWKDPRLAWNSTISAKKSILLELNEIWFPYFEMNGISKPIKIAPEKIEVLSSGDVTFNFYFHYSKSRKFTPK